MADNKNYIISINAQLKGGKVVLTGLQQIEGQTEKFSKTVNLAGKQTQDFNDILMKAGARALVVAPIWLAIRSAMMLVLRTFTEMVQANLKFEDSMSAVRTMLQGTGAEIEAQMIIAKRTILDTSLNSRRSLNDLTDAFRFLKSANLSFQETMAGFPVVASLMNAFGLSAEEASRAVAGMATTARKSFGETITLSEKFAKIGDVLAYTYVKQDVLVSELIASYAKLAPYITAVDDSFIDIVTTLGFLNTQMLRGARTGTITARALVEMTTSADKLASIFGITFDMQKPLNFLNVIEELYNRIGTGKTITAEQTKALQDTFGIRASVAVNLLVSNFDKLQDSLIDARENADGFLKRIEEIRMGTIEAQTKRLSNILAGLANDFISATYGAGDFAEAIKNLNDALVAKESRDFAKGLGYLTNQIGVFSAGIASALGQVVFPTSDLDEFIIRWKTLIEISKGLKLPTKFFADQEKLIEKAKKDAEIRKADAERQRADQDIKLLNEKIYRDDVKTTYEVLKLLGASELDITKKRIEEFDKAEKKREALITIENKLKNIKELSTYADKEQMEIFKVQTRLLEGQKAEWEDIRTERERHTSQSEYDLAFTQAQNDLLVAQVKYRKEIVDTYQKASINLLQTAGVSEGKILAIQLEQLEANKQNMGIETYLSQQKQLQLQLAGALYKEKQKELQTHNNLVIAYEKADEAEKIRLRRVSELRKLSDEELARQFEESVYDKDLILNYWNYFRQTAHDKIAEIAGERVGLEFELPTEGGITDIPDDIKKILSGESFAQELERGAIRFAERFQAWAIGAIPTQILPEKDTGLLKLAPIAEINTLIDRIEIKLPEDSLANVAENAGKQVTQELLNNERLQKALAHLLRPYI